MYLGFEVEESTSSGCSDDPEISSSSSAIFEVTSAERREEDAVEDVLRQTETDASVTETSGGNSTSGRLKRWIQEKKRSVAKITDSSSGRAVIKSATAVMKKLGGRKQRPKAGFDVELRVAVNGCARIQLLPHKSSFQFARDDKVAVRFRTICCDWEQWRRLQQCEEDSEKRMKQKLAAAERLEEDRSEVMSPIAPVISSGSTKERPLRLTAFGPKVNYNSYRTIALNSEQPSVEQCTDSAQIDDDFIVRTHHLADISEDSGDDDSEEEDGCGEYYEKAAVWRTVDIPLTKMSGDYEGNTYLNVRYNTFIPCFAADYCVMQVQLSHKRETAEIHTLTHALSASAAATALMSLKSVLHKPEWEWTDVMEFPVPFEVQPSDERIFVKDEIVNFRPFAAGALALPIDAESRSKHEIRRIQKEATQIKIVGVVKNCDFDISTMAYVYIISLPPRLRTYYENAERIAMDSEFTVVNNYQKKSVLWPEWVSTAQCVDLRNEWLNARAVTALHGLFDNWAAVAYLEIYKSPLAQCTWTGKRRTRKLSPMAFALLIVEYCVNASFDFQFGCPLCFNPDLNPHSAGGECVSATESIGSNSDSELAIDRVHYDKRLRPYLCRSMAWTKRMETVNYRSAVARYGYSRPQAFQKYLNGITTYCDSCFVEMDHFELNYFCVGESEHLTHDFCSDCVYRSVSRFQSIYASIEHILSTEFDMNLDCICEIVAFAVGVIVVV